MGSVVPLGLDVGPAGEVGLEAQLGPLDLVAISDLGDLMGGEEYLLAGGLLRVSLPTMTCTG